MHNQKKKNLPIGVSNYKELRNGNYYYVDKTLLIKDLEKSGLVVLVTRPRRFGKTLNLSMLCYFFEISETRNSSLFLDTAIWQLPEYRSLQGTFPVIFLSFRTVTKTTFETMMNQFRYVIAQEFKRHSYLLTSNKLDADEKERFLRISTEHPTEVDLDNSLEFLARMLFNYHQKKVIILIDEYDVPVQTAFLFDFYEKIISFLKNLLTGALKDQEALEKGVITGNLTLAKAGIFTGLNNLDVFNVTRNQMADKFGFTDLELKELLAYYDFEDKHAALKEWYDGYTFGTAAGLFNPWSVFKCLGTEGALEPYWVNTSDSTLLKMLIGGASAEIKTDLESLLQKNSVRHSIEESIIFPDLKTNDDLVWSLLLFSGYLTYTHFEVKENKKEWFLTIPNLEVKQMLNKLLIEIVATSIEGGQTGALSKALIEGNVAGFSSMLQSFVTNSMGAFDITNEEPEKSYHLFILGILVFLKDSYEVKSNKESGLGRYDIMLIPLKEQNPGIIIEFKKIWPESKETLEQAADKALDRIEQMHYAQELESRGIQSIIAYRIAFKKRKLLVKCRRFENDTAVECT